MRIQCPACGAAYEVPEHLLTRPDGTPARPVRCLRCAHQWQPAAPAAEAPSPAAPPEARVSEPAVPLPAIPARHMAPAQLQPGPAPARMTQESDTVAPLLAWAVSLALVAGAVLALLWNRDAVVAAWPPAAHLFSALGLH